MNDDAVDRGILSFDDTLGVRVVVDHRPHRTCNMLPVYIIQVPFNCINTFVLNDSKHQFDLLIVWFLTTVTIHCCTQVPYSTLHYACLLIWLIQRYMHHVRGISKPRLASYRTDTLY